MLSTGPLSVGGRDRLGLLLELEKDGPQPGDVLAVPVGLLVEVAQLVDALPLRPRLDLVHLGHEGLLLLPVVVLGLGQLVLVLLVPGERDTRTSIKMSGRQ